MGSVDFWPGDELRGKEMIRVNSLEWAVLIDLYESAQKHPLDERLREGFVLLLRQEIEESALHGDELAGAWELSENVALAEYRTGTDPGYHGTHHWAILLLPRDLSSVPQILCYYVVGSE